MIGGKSGLRSEVPPVWQHDSQDFYPSQEAFRKTCLVRYTLGKGRKNKQHAIETLGDKCRRCPEAHPAATRTQVANIQTHAHLELASHPARKRFPPTANL
jgi:hypothetical protein